MRAVRSSQSIFLTACLSERPLPTRVVTSAREGEPPLRFVERSSPLQAFAKAARQALDEARRLDRFRDPWAAGPVDPPSLLAIDPHAPMDARANVARNLDAFHEAFGTAEGDDMWLDPHERVSLF